ncbi:hypothetical protein DRO53_02490 [Candidatus Bathyarchaeota archaeon]|nr:MAG: hypothetical protein DRO46_02910 [Candidatus Hecatellales archaeon]RLI34921.1 MAG: hypothetical protein DRO53_02490 [Candidatus Bathyarchaeota archaeon]
MPFTGFLWTLTVSLLAFLFVWIITALAIFMAGRIVAGPEATFPKALALILVGGVIIGLFSYMAPLILGPLGWILAFLLWVWLIKSFFGVGWLGGFLIAILASIIFLVLMVFAALGLALAGFTVPFTPKVPVMPYMHVI